ncbi:MAG TPA: hypothetical protein PKV21_07690 [bacterium]|nr:hypothetical protein [bacterium]
MTNLINYLIKIRENLERNCLYEDEIITEEEDKEVEKNKDKIPLIYDFDYERFKNITGYLPNKLDIPTIIRKRDSENEDKGLLKSIFEGVERLKKINTGNILLDKDDINNLLSI